MLRFRKILRKRDGFTLIELLVVVAILGILATIGIPRVIGVMDDARASKAASDLALITGALERYYVKYSVYPPSLKHLVAGPTVGVGGIPDPKFTPLLKTSFTFQNAYDRYYFYAVSYYGNDDARSLQQYALGDPGRTPSAAVAAAYDVTPPIDPLPEGKNPSAADLIVAFAWGQWDAGTVQIIVTTGPGKSISHTAYVSRLANVDAPTNPNLLRE